jgi:iron(III) transport system substrate-binding protein
MQPALDLFKLQFPEVEVVLKSGRNNELAAQILEERGNPAADLLIATDALPLQSLDAENALAPNSSPAVMAVPATYRDAEGSWTALTLRGRVIMYNTELVSAAEAPQSIFELTDPKWKGQIAAAGSTNGSMQAQIAGLVALEGEAATEEWLRGLIANDVTFFGGHTDVRKAVGKGEFKLGLVNHYYYFLEKAEGSPVAVVWPDQGDGQIGMFTNPTAVGLVAGGPNPEAARAFVDFLLTAETQDVFARVNYEYPIVPDAPLGPDVPPLAELHLADVAPQALWDALRPAEALVQKTGLP